MIQTWLNKPAYLMTPLDDFLTWIFAVIAVSLIGLAIYARFEVGGPMKTRKPKRARKPKRIGILLNGRKQFLDPVDIPVSEIRRVARHLLKFADWAESKERKCSR